MEYQALVTKLGLGGEAGCHLVLGEVGEADMWLKMWVHTIKV